MASKGRILIVDDECDILAIFEKALSQDGFAVKTFSKPEHALQNFKPDNFDLAILDIRMPKMSGFELCREIRKIDAKINIYFMTAFEMHKEEFDKVFPSIRVDGFMKKPITIAKLCSLVNSELGKSSRRQNVRTDISVVAKPRACG